MVIFTYHENHAKCTTIDCLIWPGLIDILSWKLDSFGDGLSLVSGWSKSSRIGPYKKAANSGWCCWNCHSLPGEQSTIFLGFSHRSAVKGCPMPKWPWTLPEQGLTGHPCRSRWWRGKRPWNVGQRSRFYEKLCISKDINFGA